MEWGGAFVRSLRLERDKVETFDEYPYSIPAIRMLDELALDPHVTFFVGENGAGKSTLVEAIAVALRFNAEGGTINYNFATRRSESDLHKLLRIARGTRRPRDGFFLRAESYFNVATKAEEIDADSPQSAPTIGGVAHEMSHGESFDAETRAAVAGVEVHASAWDSFDDSSTGRRTGVSDVVQLHGLGAGWQLRASSASPTYELTEASVQLGTSASAITT